jgi:hypothetical protein
MRIQKWVELVAVESPVNPGTVHTNKGSAFVENVMHM